MTGHELFGDRWDTMTPEQRVRELLWAIEYRDMRIADLNIFLDLAEEKIKRLEAFLPEVDPGPQHFHPKEIQ